MPKIAIDYTKCLTIVEHIRSLGGVPPDREDPMSHSFPAHVAENGWCATVAINHQTTPIVGPALRGYVNGAFLRGWDYLLQRSIFEANHNPRLFTVEWLLDVTAEELRGLFRDDKEGETFLHVEGRARILNDLGAFLTANNWRSVHGAYLVSGGYIIRSDGRGLAQLLAQARGYGDPVQKKLFYFLSLMRNQGF